MKRLLLVVALAGCTPQAPPLQQQHKIGAAYFCVQLGDSRSACMERATPKQQAAITACSKPELVHVDVPRFAKCVNAKVKAAK